MVVVCLKEIEIKLYCIKNCQVQGYSHWILADSCRKPNNYTWRDLAHHKSNAGTKDTTAYARWFQLTIQEEMINSTKRLEILSWTNQDLKMRFICPNWNLYWKRMVWIWASLLPVDRMICIKIRINYIFITMTMIDFHITLLNGVKICLNNWLNLLHGRQWAFN